MKKYISILLFFICFFGCAIFADALELDVTSQNAILINLNEEKVLYEKNSSEQVSIASLTKIMTAIIALENITDLDETIIISPKDLSGLKEANAATVGFQVGEKVTYRDLLYGLLLASGADAAQALTRTVAGGQENFILRMNQKAISLGMDHTHFVNETGLDAEEHYSTVEEVANMFQYALQNAEFKKIIETQQYTTSNNSITVSSTVFRNIKKNQLDLDYVLGGKTGTTTDAGLCLASVAHSNGTDYLLVTVRAPQEGKQPNNFYDAKTIYDYFIEHYQNQMVIEEGDPILTLSIPYTKEASLNFLMDETIIKYLPKDFNKEQIKIEYQEIIPVDFRTKIGTKLGQVKIYYHDELITSKDIILQSKLHFNLFEYLKKHWIIIILSILIIIWILLTWIKLIKKGKRRSLKIML